MTHAPDADRIRGARLSQTTTAPVLEPSAGVRGPGTANYGEAPGPMGSEVNGRSCEDTAHIIWICIANHEARRALSISVAQWSNDRPAASRVDSFCDARVTVLLSQLIEISRIVYFYDMNISLASYSQTSDDAAMQEFLREVSGVQEMLAKIREVQQRLEKTNQQAKLATKPQEISACREKAQKDIQVRTYLHLAAEAHRPSCPGSHPPPTNRPTKIPAYRPFPIAGGQPPRQGRQGPAG